MTTEERLTTLERAVDSLARNFHSWAGRIDKAVDLLLDDFKARHKPGVRQDGGA